MSSNYAPRVADGLPPDRGTLTGDDGKLAIPRQPGDPTKPIFEHPPNRCHTRGENPRTRGAADCRPGADPESRDLLSITLLDDTHDQPDLF